MRDDAAGTAQSHDTREDTAIWCTQRARGPAHVARCPPTPLQGECGVDQQLRAGSALNLPTSECVHAPVAPRRAGMRRGNVERRAHGGAASTNTLGREPNA